MTEKSFSRQEVNAASKEYFQGDDLSVSTFADKYALRDGENYFESTPRDMHKRLAKEFARVEGDFGGPSAVSEQEFFEQMDHFRKIVPQGSPMAGIGNNTKKVTLANCFVIGSPRDSMSGIMDTAKDMANLYKSRGGVGVDLSTLRPSGFGVNNAALTSTGAYSFADLFSDVTSSVGQKGRRGALMVSIDVHHPDVEHFITMKHDRTKVTSANISVRISDEFMEAVEKGETYEQRWPMENPEFTRQVDAVKVWNLIMETAYADAEPGVLFWNRMVDYTPSGSYPQFRPICCNPCAEIAMAADSNCRLISLVLKYFAGKFTGKKKTWDEFDWAGLDRTTRVGVRMGDNLVGLDLEKMRNIVALSDEDDEKTLWGKFIKQTEAGREIGIGTTALADTLAIMGYKYDTEEAIEFANELYRRIAISAYSESIKLAKERGAFPAFSFEAEEDNEFIQNILPHLSEDDQRDYRLYGRRHIALLTQAPTGSVSLEAQTSSGIEPVFKKSYNRKKKLDGAGDPNNPMHVQHENGEWFEKFPVFHRNIREYLEIFPEDEDNLPDFFVVANDIDWKMRVKMQAVIQRWVDHSISSTVNLPADISVKDVGGVYKEAWRQGLKGITVYREGSREGVLVADDESPNEFKMVDPIKRPEILECDIHHASIKDEKWTILVGLVEGKPYEVFSGLSKHMVLSRKHTKGHLKKRSYKTKPNRYDLIINKDDGDKEKVIEDIVDVFKNLNYPAFSRVISLALRHGGRASYVSEQLFKDADSDFFNFNKVVGRVLKKYIKDGETPESSKCPECGEKLVYSEGCKKCMSCGVDFCN